MHVLSYLPAILFGSLVIAVFYVESRLQLLRLWDKIRKKPPRKTLSKSPAIAVHILSAVGLLCILYGYFIEPYWVEISIVPVATAKLKSATFRVVQISDLHCTAKPRAEAKVVELVNRLKPDIIVFTGDALGQAKGLGLFRKTLAALEAPLGKFAVTGNWDEEYWRTLNLFSGTGFRRLAQDVVEATKDGESIRIAGLDLEKGPDSWPVVKQLTPQKFNLFLYHNTNLVDYFQKVPIDLYLCGHTHGGQIALPFYGALITMSSHGKKYEAGLYRDGPFPIYVNRGIGMDGPKIRFLARPEITLFDIAPAKNAKTLSQKTETTGTGSDL